MTAVWPDCFPSLFLLDVFGALFPFHEIHDWPGAFGSRIATRRSATLPAMEAPSVVLSTRSEEAPP